jgi:hypothetical protein
MRRTPQPRRRAAHPAERALPPSVLCARLGEDFELFSDRTDHAVECENLIHVFEAIRDADGGAPDLH